MIVIRKKICILAGLCCILGTLFMPGISVAQYENSWMSVGSLHNWFSEIGCEVEQGWVLSQQFGWRWPAIYDYQDSQAAKGFWMGCRDFTDETGNFYPYKVVHVGPRTSGAYEFFPITFEMVSRFDAPLIYVDGAVSFRDYVEVDRIDPALKADRMLLNVTNSSIGITMTRKIMQFSHPYHDNYIIIEYNFKNTGNTDADETIELPSQVLQDVYFFPQYRWSSSRETRYVIGNGTGWGMQTMLDTRGDGVRVDPPNENFRAQYSWHGNFPPFTSYDNIGGPIWNPGTSAGYVGAADSVGRLGAAQFIGVVTMHADKSAQDDSDDPSQPSTTGYMGSDISITMTNDQFDKAAMEEEYGWMSRGHMSPRHAWVVEPDGDFAKPMSKADPALGTPGGFSAINGYGPYTLNPGEEVTIILAEAAAGLSRERCIEVGRNYKNGVIDARTKNEAVLSGKDSLFQTFRRAIANYESGYELAQPALPPTIFYVDGGGDRIALSWDAPADGALSGFEIYRARGRYDSTYTMIASMGPEARSYNDTDVERGPGYYYYIVTLTETESGNTALNIPAHTLKSGRYYTQTFDPANLKRPAGEDIDDIRVVPNPYNISADQNSMLFPGERDKIAFFNIPGNCDIKIYTEIGELVTSIKHRDGTGDEYWNCTTDSKQIVVSGVYLAVVTDTDTGSSKIVKFVIIR